MSDIKPDQHADHEERRSRPPYALCEDKKKDGFKAKWTGQCYCGNVQVSPSEADVVTGRIGTGGKDPRHGMLKALC